MLYWCVGCEFQFEFGVCGQSWLGGDIGFGMGRVCVFEVGSVGFRERLEVDCVKDCNIGLYLGILKIQRGGLGRFIGLDFGEQCLGFG